MMKKKTVVLGVAGALAVAGGGAAIAATQNDSGDSQAVIDDVAKQLGVTPSALSGALKAALKNRVDAAVAAGRLTKAEGDALKARIDAGDLPLVLGGFGLHHGGPGHYLELDAAADFLGLTESQLRDELSGGKTLAQVAKDHSKSVDGLIDAMVAEAKKHLDDAVADGRVTRAQADSILADLKQRITDRVNNGTFRGFGGFRRFDRDQFRGPGATF
jgi:hypothetical protein